MRASLAILEFAHQVVERLEVRRHALRVMHQVANVTGESVSLNVLAELEQAQRRGYAVNDEETEPGVRDVAAPIFDDQGQVAAALSLGAPVLRVADLPPLGSVVVAAAARVSAGLGHRAPVPAAVVGGEAAS